MCFQAQQHPKLTAIHFRRGEGVEEGGTQAWNPQNIKALKETAKNPLHRCLLALEKRLKTWAASGRSRRHRGHPGPCSCSHKTLPPHFFPKTAQPEHKALPRSSHLRAHLNQGDAAASCDQGLPPLQGAWGFLRDPDFNISTSPSSLCQSISPDVPSLPGATLWHLIWVTL